MTDEAITQAGYRVADAERALVKELERVYGPQAKHARNWHHTDPGLLAIAGERSAASEAYHDLMNQARSGYAFDLGYEVCTRCAAALPPSATGGLSQAGVCRRCYATICGVSRDAYSVADAMLQARA